MEDEDRLKPGCWIDHCWCSLCPEGSHERVHVWTKDADDANKDIKDKVKGALMINENEILAVFALVARQKNLDQVWQPRLYCFRKSVVQNRVVFESDLAEVLSFIILGQDAELLLVQLTFYFILLKVDVRYFHDGLQFFFSCFKQLSGVSEIVKKTFKEMVSVDRAQVFARD